MRQPFPPNVARASRGPRWPHCRGALFGRRAFSLIGLVWAASPEIGHADDEAARASAFIHEAGVELGGIVRLTGAPDARRTALKSFLDRVVDFPDLARYCIGRAWTQADIESRRRYQDLFETVILLNVLSRLDSYTDGGPPPAVGIARRVGDEYEVPITVRSGGVKVLDVVWRVSFASGTPRIVDVSAVGISLRVTLRGDFTSYLRRNGNDLGALLSAMRQMIARFD